jgi:hypothetical protein
MVPIEESMKYKILSYPKSELRMVAAISNIVVPQGQMILDDLVKSVRI